MRLANPSLRDDTLDGVVTRIQITPSAAAAAASTASTTSSPSSSTTAPPTVRISVQPDGRVSTGDGGDDDDDDEAGIDHYQMPAEVVVSSWDALTPLPDVQIALQV